MKLEDQLSSIFDKAIGLASIEKRNRFLDAVCVNNQDLRNRLEKLLSAFEDCNSLFTGMSELGNVPNLEEVIHSAGRSKLSSDPRHSIKSTPFKLGRFELLDEIGTGGFGVVFRSRQISPFEREVAIKLIKPGMDSQEVLKRFNLERQAMAIMDHAAIAKIFDAGTTPMGRPYFVMELVNGLGIKEFCDGKKLSIAQRLEVIVKVCEGVQHAHQKGVIHRDIKPNNILVVELEEGFQPKLIDFGVAKALAWQDPGLKTQVCQRIGTPLYMSPEQAKGNKDIDVRSDIYSIGAVLFELVTGTTKVDLNKLNGVRDEDVFNLLSNPATPAASKVIKSKLDGAEFEPDNFGETSSNVYRQVRGELDWIIAKATHSDREQRYETVVELTNDLRRFLRGEPVEAARPSTAYRMKKFVARNRTAVAVLSGVVAMLIASTILSINFAARSNRNAKIAIAAKEKAETARMDAETATEAAIVAKNHAMIEKEKFEVLFSDVSGLINAMSIVDPKRRKGSIDNLFLSIRNGNNKTIGSEKQLRDIPELHAKYLYEWAKNFRRSGLNLNAIELAEKSFQLHTQMHGDRHRSTLDAMHEFVMATIGHHSFNRNSNTVLPYLKKGISVSENLIRYESQMNPENNRLVEAKYNLGDLLERSGQSQRAQKLFRKIIDSEELSPTPNHFYILSSHNRLRWNDKNDEILELQENWQRFEKHKTQLTLEDVETLETMLRMKRVAILSKQGRQQDAIEDIRKLIEISGHGSHDFQRVFHAGYLGVLATSFDVLNQHYQSLDAAINWLDLLEHNKLFDRNSSSNKAALLKAYKLKSNQYLKLGYLRTARSMQEQWSPEETAFSSTSAQVMSLQYQRIKTLSKLGDKNSAISLAEKVLSDCKSSLSESHVRTIFAMNYLATTLESAGQFAKARSIRHRAIEQSNKKNLIAVKIHERKLGGNYLLTSEPDRAIAILEKSLAEYQANQLEPNAHSPTREWYVMQQLALAFNQKNDFVRADKLLIDLLNQQLQVYREENFVTLETRAQLAELLLARMEFDAANFQFRKIDECFKAQINQIAERWGHDWQWVHSNCKWLEYKLQRVELLRSNSLDFDELVAQIKKQMLNIDSSLVEVDWNCEKIVQEETLEQFSKIKKQAQVLIALVN